MKSKFLHVKKSKLKGVKKIVYIWTCPMCDTVNKKPKDTHNKINCSWCHKELDPKIMKFKKKKKWIKLSALSDIYKN